MKKLSIYFMAIMFVIVGCTDNKSQSEVDDQLYDDVFTEADLFAAKLLDETTDSDLMDVSDSVGDAAVEDATVESMDDSSYSTQSGEEVDLKVYKRRRLYICFLKRKESHVFHNVILEIPALNKFLAVSVKTQLDGDGNPSNNFRTILSRRWVRHTQRDVFIPSRDITLSVDFFTNKYARFAQAIATEINLGDRPVHPGRFRGVIAAAGGAALVLSTGSLCYNPNLANNNSDDPGAS